MTSCSSATNSKKASATTGSVILFSKKKVWWIFWKDYNFFRHRIHRSPQNLTVQICVFCGESFNLMQLTTSYEKICLADIGIIVPHYTRDTESVPDHAFPRQSK